MNELRYIFVGVFSTVAVIYIAWLIKNFIDIHKSKQAIYVIDFKKETLTCSRCKCTFGHIIFELYDLYDDVIKCPVCGCRIKGIKVLKEGDKNDEQDT